MVKYQALQRNVSEFLSNQFLKEKIGKNYLTRKFKQDVHLKIYNPKENEEKTLRPGLNVNNCKTSIWPYALSRRISHSNSIWDDVAIYQPPSRICCLVQPLATIKTYTFHNIRSKPYTRKQKKQRKDLTFAEKIIKFYRETISIKTNQTIMKKKRPCHLSDRETEIDAIVEEKWRAAQEPLNIDSYLSNHLLKQAERKQSPDVNVSLKSPCYPYIPCPLRPSKDNTPGNYAFTSLAPLFKVDPLIMNKENKNSEAEAYLKQRCISINFWSQFPQSEKQPIEVPTEERGTTYSSCINNSGPPVRSNKYATVELRQPLPDHNKADYNAQPSQKGVHDFKPASTHQFETPNKCDSFPKRKSVQKCESIKQAKYDHKVEKCEEPKSEKPESHQPHLNDNETKPIEPICPLIDSKQPPRFIGNYYTVQSPPRNLNKEEKKPYTNIRDKLLSNELKIRDIKPSKHMNLNFPNRMTSPNQMKHIKKPKDLKIDFSKVIKSIQGDKVDNATVNREKLLKQLKKIYDIDPTENLGLKKDMKMLTKNSIPSRKNLNKHIKNQYPMTSPNNLIHKNKS